MHFLEQRAGDKIFQSHSWFIVNLAGIIKIILGGFKNGSGNIAMKRRNPLSRIVSIVMQELKNEGMRNFQ